MKIIYDVSSAQPQGKIITNGGGEYSIVVLEKLIKKRNQEIIDILLNSNKGTTKKIQNLVNDYNLNVKEYSSINEMETILNDYDKIIFPIFYPDYSQLNINKQKNIIGLIHDMSSFYGYYITDNKYEFIQKDGLDWARYIYKKLITKKMLSLTLSQHKALFKLTNKTQIFTVSYYSKSALEFFIPNCKVQHVFYSPNRKINECKYNEYEQIPGKFFLLINGSRWAKNNLRVVFIIDELFCDTKFNKKFSDFKLIITGCNETVKRFIQSKIKNPDKFDIRGFVEDDELSYLYKNAFLFLYPSILEGFGYPPIEAMELGTLCACSTSTSIPEICGDAVLYFDPYDNDSIKMAILRSFEADIRHEYQVKIQRRLKELKIKQENDTNKLIEIILQE